MGCHVPLHDVAALAPHCAVELFPSVQLHVQMPLVCETPDAVPKAQSLVGVVVRKPPLSLPHAAIPCAAQVAVVGLEVPAPAEQVHVQPVPVFVRLLAVLPPPHRSAGRLGACDTV